MTLRGSAVLAEIASGGQFTAPAAPGR